MPTLILVTDTNPGTARWEDSSLLGGGCTVIPAGGTIGGVYDCPVICLGDVTMNANVTCRTTLVVQGTLFNPVGLELSVGGDFYGNALDFSHTDTDIPQGDVTIGGNAYLANVTYTQYARNPSTFLVKGDLIDRTENAFSAFDGDGFSNSGTNGCALIVYGNVVFGSINLAGADAVTNAFASGNGGFLQVNGNLMLSEYFNAIGGNHFDGNDAGNGGNFDVQGCATVGVSDYYIIDLDGGTATNGSGGNGGYINVWGDMTCCGISSDGGNCSSADPTKSAGSGGNLYVYGNFNSLDTITFDGGYRSGALTGPYTGFIANGGSIFVVGQISVSGDINLRGGSTATADYPVQAGFGGYLESDSDVTVTDDVRTYGGSADFGDGNNGGNIQVGGNLFVRDFTTTRGGNAFQGTSGSAGSIYVNGNATLGELESIGGDAVNGYGGNGGSLIVSGMLVFTGSNLNSLAGGACDSANQIYWAGNGGSITSCGLTCYGFIVLNGGNRTGATTVASNVPSPNSGNITCRGSLTCTGFISASGGYCQTDYPCSAGGRGGDITVSGSMSVGDTLSMVGGLANGRNAGDGGNLEVIGFAKLSEVATNGGDANNSVVGGDAGINGSAGTAIFRSGASIGALNQRAGAGPGTTSGNSVYLNIAGSFTVGSLSMSDLPAYYIVAGTGAPCVFKTNLMAVKQTLNDNALNTSNNISAMLADSAFVSDSSSIWYRVQGTSVFGP